MFYPSPPLGKLGWMPDQPDHALPFGAWDEVKNVRFDAGYAERISEPVKAVDLEPAESGKWFLLYEDNNGAQTVYASDTKLYRLNSTADGWDDVSKALGTYTPGGKWQCFALGTSAVFNNGIDPPQILYSGAAEFKDLPNWGVVNGNQQVWKCRSLRLFGAYMVAVDVTLEGVRSQNGVLWSDPIIIDNVTQDADMPSWDYASAETRAGLNYVGVDDGPLVDSLTLGNAQILYATSGAYALQLIGGNLVFSPRKILPYGIIGINAVAAFRNYHLVVSRNAIWVHDGSTVNLVAEDRVQDTFFENLLFNFEDVSCTHDQNNKEIQILFNSTSVSSQREYLLYDYYHDTWSIGQAFTTQNDVFEYVSAMAYGFELPQGATTYATWTQTFATLGDTTFNSLRRDGERRVMYWLTDKGLYKADEEPAQDVNKTYRLYREKIDFSELSPTFTVNNVKQLDEFIPYIDGEAPTEFTMGWSMLPRSGTNPQAPISFDPVNQYKVDCRISGRFLSMDINLTDAGSWRLSTMDYDMEVTDGR